MAAVYTSEVGALKSVLVKHAADAFRSEEAIERQWRDLGFTGAPAFARANAESDRLLEILAGFGARVHRLQPDDRTGLDSLYARDASIGCRRGMILCNMGKPARVMEPSSHAAAFHDFGVPVAGAIEGEGRLEGGDIVWIDERTIAVGRGYRTNDEGIHQLTRILADTVDHVVVVGLPHHRGPTDVFHLMSILSPIDRDLALVYSPLMPVAFRELLLGRGYRLVEVPEAEFETMGCNVLAVAPRRCLMIAGNPETRRRLERAGAEVHELPGREICAKGAGGPTCLVRPILREI